MRDFWDLWVWRGAWWWTWAGQGQTWKMSRGSKGDKPRQRGRRHWHRYQEVLKFSTVVLLFQLSQSSHLEPPVYQWPERSWVLIRQWWGVSVSENRCPDQVLPWMLEPSTPTPSLDSDFWITQNPEPKTGSGTQILCVRWLVFNYWPFLVTPALP